MKGKVWKFGDAISTDHIIPGRYFYLRSNLPELSKHLLEYVPITVNMKPNVEKAQVIVLLDTNTIQQLGGLAERVTKSAAPIIVIDHHAVHPETERMAKLCATNEEASSTCEIVYNFFKQLNTKPD